MAIVLRSNTARPLTYVELDGNFTYLRDRIDDVESRGVQELSLTGTTLEISNGNTVDLSSFVNTDEQTLSFVGSTLSISGGNSVDLSSLLDNTDDQTLSFVGSTLSISGGNSVDLSSLLDNTDDQTLDLIGTTLTISNGNSVDLSGFLTSETVTSLSLAANQLVYVDENSNTTSIDLSLYLDDTNLARLVGGTIDGATGIATFTRDDATSFTVDFSPLFDDTNLTRITSGSYNPANSTLTLSRDSDGTRVDVDLSALSGLTLADVTSNGSTTTDTVTFVNGQTTGNITGYGSNFIIAPKAGETVLLGSEFVGGFAYNDADSSLTMVSTGNITVQGAAGSTVDIGTGTSGTVTVGSGANTVDFPSGTTVDFTGSTVTGLPITTYTAGNGITIDVNDEIAIDPSVVPTFEAGGSINLGGNGISNTGIIGFEANGFLTGSAWQMYASTRLEIATLTSPVLVMGQTDGGTAITLRSNNLSIVGDMDMNTNVVTNLGAPVNGTDAANKTYVDNTVAAATGTDLSNYYTKPEVDTITGAITLDDVTTAGNSTNNEVQIDGGGYLRAGVFGGWFADAGTGAISASSSTSVTINGSSGANLTLGGSDTGTVNIGHGGNQLNFNGSALSFNASGQSSVTMSSNGNISTISSGIVTTAAVGGISIAGSSGGEVLLGNGTSGNVTLGNGSNSIVFNATTSGIDYNDISNTPALATVATSGDYNDLINGPGQALDDTATPSFFALKTGTVFGPDNPNTGNGFDLSILGGANNGGTNDGNVYIGSTSPTVRIGKIGIDGTVTLLGTVDFTSTVGVTGLDYSVIENTPDLSVYATEVYVDNAVSALVDTAPTTLDTLNELAAALGDDPNFATTVTNNLALKANSADLATVATSGSYNDLTDKPTIVTAPTTAGRVAFADGAGDITGDNGFDYDNTSNTLSVNNIDVNVITGNFEIETTGKTHTMRVETNSLDDETGTSGFTLRASNNPTNVDAGTNISGLSTGDVGAMFSVRSSGLAARLWVGQGITSTGDNDFYVGDTSADNSPWKGAKAVIIASSGEARFDGEVYAFYSDERLKNFEGKIDNALDKVSQLNGYYYKGNEKAGEFGYDTEKLQVGVSAQEVEAVMPEVVAPAPVDPEYKTVKYEKMVPLLIEAIKELKDQNKELLERINKLEGNE